MKLQCPNCAVFGQVPDEYLGKNLRCPKCDSFFMAPTIEDLGLAKEVSDSDDVTVLPDAVEENLDTPSIDEPIERIDEDQVEPIEEDLSEEEVVEDLSPTDSVDDLGDEQEEIVSEEAADEVAETVDDVELVEDLIADEVAPETEEVTDPINDDLLDSVETEELQDTFDEPVNVEDELAEIAEEEVNLAEDTAQVAVASEVVEEVAEVVIEPDVDNEEKTFEQEDSDILEEELIAEENLPVPEEPVVEEVAEEARQVPPPVSLVGDFPKGGLISTVSGESEKSDHPKTESSLPETPVEEPKVKEQADEASEPVARQRLPETFAITDIIKSGFRLTKGVKGRIWGGIAVMYLMLFGLAALSTFIVPEESIVELFYEVGISLFSALFCTSFICMGIKVARGKQINWRMIFSFKDRILPLIITFIWEWFFIAAGFLLLILPGIYLSIGYSFAMVLVLEKKMNPWQAMEASRRAIHKVWWKFFGLYLLVGLLCAIAAIPLGLGLIWMLPVSIVTAGVAYCCLFKDGLEAAE